MFEITYMLALYQSLLNKVKMNSTALSFIFLQSEAKSLNLQENPINLKSKVIITFLVI
jgi:hypothetical protein